MSPSIRVTRAFGLRLGDFLVRRSPASRGRSRSRRSVDFPLPTPFVIRQGQVGRTGAAVEDRARQARAGRSSGREGSPRLLSMFRLNRWLSRSYLPAIDANIDRTRRPDLSTEFEVGVRCIFGHDHARPPGFSDPKEPAGRLDVFPGIRSTLFLRLAPDVHCWACPASQAIRNPEEIEPPRRQGPRRIDGERAGRGERISLRISPRYFPPL